MTLLFRNLAVSLNRDESRLAPLIERRLHLRHGSMRDVTIVKKSLDNRRGRHPRFVYSLAFDLDARLEEKLLARTNPIVERFERRARAAVALAPARAGSRPVIVGAGPSGLFAAHRLVAGGARPVIIERGPEVTARSKRWHRFVTGGEFDPECNLLFGEGGAGAYSDGKLYTRVSDPRVPEVLAVLARSGAPREILYDARPHVGSNLLPSIVRRMREQLIADGAEFRFDTRMAALVLDGTHPLRRVAGVELDPGGRLAADTVFLGTGHSARDVYRMLHALGVALEPKPYQMGVRVEHPQTLIDELQYGESAGHPRLPPAEYQHVAKRPAGDVFSFCMCPGGEILPATEKTGFICVNGASRHKRTSPFANSGFVLTVDAARFPATGDALGGLVLQEEVESAAARAAGVPFAVPALRLDDFLDGRVSATLPDCSYPLARTAAAFDGFLPDWILSALREGLAILGRRIPGFITNAAIVVGPESRSSSPVRIVRHPDSLESVSAAGLYPMGEGAGFAGGILSAAIDGMLCAEAWLGAPVAREGLRA